MLRRLGLVSCVPFVLLGGLVCSTVRKLSVVFVLNYGTGKRMIKGWLVRLMTCYDVLFFFLMSSATVLLHCKLKAWLLA